MNAKKAGLIAAGALTALVVASPVAWAFGPSEVADPNCVFVAEGDDAVETSTTDRDNPINVVPQAPQGGNNAGIVGECSTFNNNNNQNNNVGNTINGTPVPTTQAPGLSNGPELDLPS